MAHKIFALCLLILSCGLGVQAAVLPDDIGKYHRTSAKDVTLTDRPLWQEYGFQQGETAVYQAGGEEFTVTAWRLQDATGALGAFDWQRPEDSKSSSLATLAAETKDGLWLVHNNYLLSFAGHQPDNAELVALAGTLKNVDGAPLPSLRGYLPAANLVPNSERYILGPAGLGKFVAGIAPSTAGFHFNAEAQLGRFKTPAGEQTLAIFQYPNAQIARQRLEEFQKAPNVMAKRSGPLIGVVVGPTNNDAAEALLSRVRYQANLTLDEYVPTRRDNIGVLIINAFELIGILLIFASVAGFAYGGLRVLRRKKGIEADALTTLHLADR